ncbi:hypothetical protein DO70_6472 [Burkholderia pseudomallei]|nr:hypothetical protein DO70_6472 [Burkholderia pseudomallei]
MRGEPAHRMECNRVAGDGIVRLAPRVGPADRQRDLVIARDVRHLMREPADRRGRNARDSLRPLRRAFGHALAQQRERGRDGRAVVERVAAVERGRCAARVMRNRPAAAEIPPQVILRKQRIALGARRIAHEEAERVGFGAHVQQLGRVRVARDEVAVVAAGLDQLANHRHEQRAVGAGADRYPFVGDCRVAGADRVDRDEPSARALEFRDRDLQRIRMMILGGADHEEQLRAIEIGAAEFPERAADRIDHAGRHVRRAKAAVRRVIRRAVLLREQAGERLHLVAAGEEREALRIRRAQMREPLFEHGERDVPRYRLELRAAALGARLAHQRLREARGRILFHDARCAFRADHALVQRMVGVAVDVADFAVAQMHADAAAACAHVAGRRLHFAWFAAGSRTVVHVRSLHCRGGPVEASATLVDSRFACYVRRSRMKNRDFGLMSSAQPIDRRDGRGARGEGQGARDAAAAGRAGFAPCRMWHGPW